MYYLHRVRRIPRPPRDVPAHWRVGTAVHAGLEGAYRAAQSRGTRDDSMWAFREEAEQAFVDSWRAEELAFTHGQYDWAMEGLQRTLQALTAPRPEEVLLVEDQLLEVTAEGVIVHGYPDLLLQVDDQTVKVRDWKVSSRPESSESVARSPQLALYAWMVRRRWPDVTRVLVEEYYPPVQRAVGVLSSPSVQAEVLERVEMVAEMVEGDSEWAPNPGERCEWCAFKQHCPVWSDAAVVEAKGEADGF